MISQLYGVNAYPSFQGVSRTTLYNRTRVRIYMHTGATTGVQWNQIYEGLCGYQVGLSLGDILAPYVREILPQVSAPSTNSASGYFDVKARWNPYMSEVAFARLFKLTQINEDDNTQSSESQFVVFSDWSYDTNQGANAAGGYKDRARSEPIDGAVIPGQWIFITSMQNAGITFHEETAQGPISLTNIEPVTKTDNTDDTPADFYFPAVKIYEALQDKKDRFIPFGKAAGASSFMSTIGEPLHFVDPCAARYVLYYVNAYGGWDAFVIRGKVKESDTMETSEYRTAVVNMAGQASELNRRQVIMKTITKNYEMYTHWLSDKQATRMHHLTESPCVYLHDLTAGTIRPVVVMDSRFEYKSYKGNGNKLVSCVMNVELATELMRR